MCQNQTSQTESNKDVPHDSMVFLEKKLRQMLASNKAVASDLHGHMKSAATSVAASQSAQNTRDSREIRAANEVRQSARAKNFYHQYSAAVAAHFSRKVVGLAIVEVASVYRAVTSPLEPEQRSLLHFVVPAASRVNSVFVRVIDCVMLAEPCMPIVSGIKSYANHAGVFLTASSAEKMFDAPCIPVDEETETMHDRMETWVEIPDYEKCFTELEDSFPRFALVVHPTLAVLAASGLLSYLVFPPQSRFPTCNYMRPFVAEFQRLARKGGRMPGESPALCLDTDAAKVLETECENLGSEGLDRDMLLRVANTLREYRSKTVQSPDVSSHIHALRGAMVASEAVPEEDETGHSDLELQRQIVWLEGMYRATGKERVSQSRMQRSARGFYGVWNNDMGCYVTYKPAFLLQCVVLSFDLRSSGRLPDVIQASAGCLPEFWKHTVESLLSNSCTPSPGTMTKARLIVDVGFMLWMRKRHNEMLRDDRLTVFFKGRLHAFRWKQLGSC